ncbi:MAG: hypothetical protein AB1324_04125 [Candidatus Micrarchaeota archaeon]
MRGSFARSESEFTRGLLGLERDLAGVIRTAQGVPQEHRAWARDLLEAGARAVMTGAPLERKALERMLASSPTNISIPLLSSLSAALSSAVSLPDTQNQRDAVRQELENAASQLFSGHLPGQGPPAGMLEHYRQVMRSRPRRM